MGLGLYIAPRDRDAPTVGSIGCEARDGDGGSIFRFKLPATIKSN